MTAATKRTPRNYYQGRSGWKLPEPERHGRLAPRDSFVASHDSIVWPSSHLASMAPEDALRCACVLAWYAPVGTVVHDTYAHRLRRHPRPRRGRVTKARKAGTTFGGRRPSHTKRRCTHETSNEWSNLERRFKLKRDAKPGNHRQVEAPKMAGNVRFAGESKAGKRVGCSCGLTTSEEGLAKHWRQVLAGPKPETETACCGEWAVADDGEPRWEITENACDWQCTHDHHERSFLVDRVSKAVDGIVLLRQLIPDPPHPKPIIADKGDGRVEYRFEVDGHNDWSDALCSPFEDPQAEMHRRYAAYLKNTGRGCPDLQQWQGTLTGLLIEQADELRDALDDVTLYLPLADH